MGRRWPFALEARAGGSAGRVSLLVDGGRLAKGQLRSGYWSFLTPCGLDSHGWCRERGERWTHPVSGDLVHVQAPGRISTAPGSRPWPRPLGSGLSVPQLPASAPMATSPPHGAGVLGRIAAPRSGANPRACARHLVWGNCPCGCNCLKHLETGEQPGPSKWAQMPPHESSTVDQSELDTQAEGRPCDHRPENGGCGHWPRVAGSPRGAGRARPRGFSSSPCAESAAP